MHFFAKGHPNILATHKNTFEFTKEEHLTKNGDCIIGVGADFDAKTLSAFAQKHQFVKITMTCEGITETVVGRTNPDFFDETEVVVRLGEHVSPRTFAVRADKSAKHLSREMVKKLQKGATMEVKIEEATEQK